MRDVHLKKMIVLAVALLFPLVKIYAQNDAPLIKEAQNLELKFDEAGALEKYKKVVTDDPSNIQALVKCAEINCSIGARQKDKKSRAAYYTTAQNFAQQAYIKDSSNANACYVNALAAFRMTETDDDNKKLIEDIKQIKNYADKAVALNANHAKANYILGKWHFELIHAAWIKKPAVKNFYTGIFDTQIDSAAYFMEKSRNTEPYFALDYLELAKVYAYDHQPGKAIDVLNKLIKLPNRSYDDIAIKDEGKQMLAAMQ